MAEPSSLQVLDALTATRVLCMSFEDGCNVTDLPSIHEMGLDVRVSNPNLGTPTPSAMSRHAH
eukprot:890472-Rhodomonas_salina.3